MLTSGGDTTIRHHGFGRNKRKKVKSSFQDFTTGTSGIGITGDIIPDYANVMFSSTTGNTSNSYTLTDATNINQ